MDPIQRFVEWYDAAVAAGAPMPDAMVMSTTAPASRVVLYRGLSNRAPRFFTNYESRKGHELARDPRVALCFHWAVLERQVRIEGVAEKLSAAESDEYFAARPYGHQLNAWASHQSETIGSRDELLARVAELTAKYPEGKVPRPPHWGGYRVVPHAIELWQGRPDRMHERELFELQAGEWTKRLLAP
jgi:pyridoxamine 5'-phosphate oxidase